jgi:serine/threonine protein kinase/tetratricopeptide (TPR) repeat protein
VRALSDRKLMPQENSPFEPSRDGHANQGGVGVPVKGDSSSSGSKPHPEFDSDSPTIFDAPGLNVPAPPLDPDATLIDPGAVPFAPRQERPAKSSFGNRFVAPVLQIGEILAGRYEILELLGEGGMGAVYKAQDRELDRPVALKLIRPELASNPDMLARFKQELLLSRQVTHKNVIRIYDLGDADGVKFISMEFVAGHDLRALIREEKKFTPAAAVEVMRQVCQALEAAHGVGVIHRDLKPQNIMREESGRIVVMDFGLARTLDGDGMTQTGALVGTMEYMSPEQALGQELDQRSDIFTAGLILYELLTGKTPFKAESTLASLIKRTQERAAPVSDHDGSITDTLTGIVQKCLERDRSLRYQSATELLQALDSWDGKRAAATLNFYPNLKPWGQSIPWHIVTGVLTALVLAVLGFIFRGKLFPENKAAGATVSLAILPFRNASGDPSLDWLGASLAHMLSTDVGQSARLRTVSQDRLHQVLSDLRVPPNSSLEPTTLRRVSEFSKADTLVWGQFVRSGGQIRIDAMVQDLKHDRSDAIKIDSVDEKDIPGAVDRLAAAVRSKLAFSSDVLKELKASSFEPSSHSAAALREYNQGIQFLRNGNNLEAVQALQAATKDDPDFALAYARLAEADSDLGYDTDAELSSRKAVDLSASLPATEKYLIQAMASRTGKDNKKAIEAYENLAKSMPDDSEVQSALAGLYTDTGNYDKARATLTRLLTLDPKNIKVLWRMGVVEFVSDNPQAALEPLNKGLALAVQADAQELKALILQSLGISYRLMNKPDEALRNYQDAMAINQRLGLKRALASNLVEMAVLQNTQGKVDAALSDYNQALQLQREIGVKKEVGDTLIDMGVVYQSKGDYPKALANFKEALQIERDTDDQNYQGLCLNNIGSVYLEQGDTDNALTYLQQALQLREKLNVSTSIAETESAIGEVYINTGQYDEALSTAMKALELWRKAGDARGAADESHDIGLVFLHQGRFGAAVSSLQDAVNGYRTIGDHGIGMVEVLSDLSDALAQAGRGSESGSLLHEAETLAHDLKNEGLQAELLTTEADLRRYSGDLKTANSYYQQALHAAEHAHDSAKTLNCRLQIAEVSLSKSESLAELRKIQQEADSRNLKYVSLESSVDVAQAMVDLKSYAPATQALQISLGKSDKLGSRYLSARIHFLLGEAQRLGGVGRDASTQYQQVVNTLDELRKDPGAEKLLDRPDIKSMYSAAAQFAGAK